jgi:hypothetical protein
MNQQKTNDDSVEIWHGRRSVRSIVIGTSTPKAAAVDSADQSPVAQTEWENEGGSLSPVDQRPPSTPSADNRKTSTTPMPKGVHHD